MSDYIFWESNDITGATNNIRMKIPETHEIFVPNRYVNKLIAQWEKYGKIIICVDWDDTLIGHSLNSPDYCDYICRLIAKAQRYGAELILWTCRQYQDIAQSYFDLQEKYGFTFTAINPDRPWKPNYSNKPYCNLLLDDKAGLDQAIDILETAIEYMRNKQNDTRATAETAKS